MNCMRKAGLGATVFAALSLLLGACERPPASTAATAATASSGAVALRFWRAGGAGTARVSFDPERPTAGLTLVAHMIAHDPALAAEVLDTGPVKLAGVQGEITPVSWPAAEKEINRLRPADTPHITVARGGELYGVVLYQLGAGHYVWALEPPGRPETETDLDILAEYDSLEAAVEWLAEYAVEMLVDYRNHLAVLAGEMDPLEADALRNRRDPRPAEMDARAAIWGGLLLHALKNPPARPDTLVAGDGDEDPEAAEEP
jgi:hypothetical protein